MILSFFSSTFTCHSASSPPKPSAVLPVLHKVRSFSSVHHVFRSLQQHLRQGHIFIGRVFAPYADIFHDGIVKENHILEYHGKIFHHGNWIDLRNIRAAKCDFSTVHIVKTSR